MDVIVNRVMRSIDRSNLSQRVRDPELARSLFQAYSCNNKFHIHSFVPSYYPWWGSREQAVFLQVLSALLQMGSSQTFKSEYQHKPSITITIDSDFDTMKKVVAYCPGPWSKRTMNLIMSNRHDDLSLVAACILVCAKWCLKNQSQLTDVSERVHACMAARLVSWWSFTPSVRCLRNSLVECSSS